MIYIDLDGVIRNILKPICQLYNTPMKDVISWDHCYGPDCLSVKQILKEHPEFYRIAPPIKSGLDIIAYLKDNNIPCKILTHQYDFGIEPTKNWIESHLVLDSHDNDFVIYTKSAEEKLRYLKNNNDILIDDNPIYATNPHVWLLKRPYNDYLQYSSELKCKILSDQELLPALKRYLTTTTTTTNSNSNNTTTANSNSIDAGTKYDDDKIRMELLPVDALTKIAEVFTKGASKYGDRNWEKGILYSRLYGALLRHLQMGFWQGEDNDYEWGKSHLAHAGCCLLMLLSMTLRRKDLDDRPQLNREANEEIR